MRPRQWPRPGNCKHLKIQMQLIKGENAKTVQPNTMVVAVKPVKLLSIFLLENKRNYVKELIKGWWYLIKVRKGWGQGWMKWNRTRLRDFNFESKTWRRRRNNQPAGWSDENWKYRMVKNLYWCYNNLKCIIVLHW